MTKTIKNKLILCVGTLSLTAFSFGLLANTADTGSGETQNTVNAVTVADEATFSMLDGASVRIDDDAIDENKAAIRFTTRVKRSEIDNNENVQIVTMITPSRYLDATLQSGFDNDDLTEDKVESIVIDVANKASAALENDAAYDSSNYYYYNAAIYNVKEANLSRAFSARSYLTIDGEVKYYSAFDFGKNSASVWQVAADEKALLEETADEYANVSALCQTYEIKAGDTTLLTVKRGERLAWHESELNEAIEELKTPVEDAANLTYTWAHEVAGLPEATASINADVNATVTYNVLKMEANGADAYAVSTGHTLAEGTELTVPATFNNLPVNKVADKAFQKNTAIKKVILPDSVYLIGSSAFEQASNLKTLVMPGLKSTISNLAQNSFYRCNALREIVVNRLRMQSGWQVFVTDANSSAVGTVNIYCLSTDTSIIEGIDYTKNNLLSGNVYVYSGTEACGYWTWKDGVYGSEIVQTPDHSYTGENGACVTCGAWDAKGISYQYGTVSLTTLAGDSNATLTVNGTHVSELTGYIVKGLLDSHTGTTVTIPDTYNDGTNGTANVIAVGSKAFKDNTTIEKVVLSENVIAIEGSAFEGCTSLVAAIMPGVIDRYANPGSGGSYIGTDAFYNCISLETLVVSSLNQVSRRVFYVDTAEYIDYQPKLKAYRYDASGTAAFGGTFRVTTDGIANANMFAIVNPGSGGPAESGYYYLYSANEPTEEQWTTTSDWWHFDDNGDVVVWTNPNA
ncbi:MAG: leucine-rich repeat protein [Clostridia bacterium]|nr:leucine-rich repeat protein [Clostridia bacterium]